MQITNRSECIHGRISGGKREKLQGMKDSKGINWNQILPSLLAKSSDEIGWTLMARKTRQRNKVAENKEDRS